MEAFFYGVLCGYCASVYEQGLYRDEIMDVLERVWLITR